MRSELIILQRSTPPCAIPSGGAVLLEGGAPAAAPLLGAGQFRQRKRGNLPLEVVLIQAPEFRLELDLKGVYTRDRIELRFRIALDLCVRDAVLLLTSAMEGRPQLSTAELAEQVEPVLAAAVGQSISDYTLSRLCDAPNLPRWLQNAIGGQQSMLGSELSRRYGLELRGVAAPDLILRLQELRQQLDARQADAERQWLDWFRYLLQSRRPPAPPDRQERRYELGEAVVTAMLAAEGRLYVATQGGSVWCLDAAGGGPIWPKPTPLGARPGDGLAVAGGRLWVPSLDGHLYGLDLETGQIAHRIPVGGLLHSAPLVLGDRVFLSVDGTAGGGGGRIAEIDPQRAVATKSWQVNQRGLRAQPTAAGNALYVGDRVGTLFRLSLANGQVQSFPLPCGPIWAPAVLDSRRQQLVVPGGDCITFLSLDGRPRLAVRLADGHVRIVRCGEGGRPVVAGPGGTPAASVVARPLLHDDRLFVGAADGRVYVLDLQSGESLCDPFKADGPIRAEPVGWQDLVYIASQDGSVYALKAECGECASHYGTGSPIWVAPHLTADGRAWVANSAGHLTALPWHLGDSAAGACRLLERGRPGTDAIELLQSSPHAVTIVQAARSTDHLEYVAILSHKLGRYGEAAKAFEELAARASGLEAGRWWARAAASWEEHREAAMAHNCRLKEAGCTGVPLLTARPAHTVLARGRPQQLQLLLENLTDALAQAVTVTCFGEVSQNVQQVRVDDVEPHGARPVNIQVTAPSSSQAYAELQVHVAYQDSRSRAQPALSQKLRLMVTD